MAKGTPSQISERMFNDICQRVGTGGTLLELGSGLTTWEFVKRGLNVISIEHDREWIKQAEGVTYVHAPMKQGWYDIDWSQVPGGYSAVLVDGPPMYKEIIKQGKTPRLHLLRHIDRFSHAATFFVDDVHRPVDMMLARMLEEILERPGVTRSAEGKRYMVI